MLHDASFFPRRGSAVSQALEWHSVVHRSCSVFPGSRNEWRVHIGIGATPATPGEHSHFAGNIRSGIRLTRNIRSNSRVCLPCTSTDDSVESDDAVRNQSQLRVGETTSTLPPTETTTHCRLGTRLGDPHHSSRKDRSLSTTEYGGMDSTPPRESAIPTRKL